MADHETSPRSVFLEPHAWCLRSAVIPLMRGMDAVAAAAHQAGAAADGLGAWSNDRGVLNQLQEIPTTTAQMKRTTDLDLGKLEDYRRRLASGSVPPPLGAYINDAGGKFVADGHHRLAVLKEAGLTSVRAWVSYAPWHLLHTHEEFVQWALDHGERIPPDVLADYPTLRRRT